MSLNKLFEIENFFDQNNEKQLKACCGEIDSSDSLNDFFCFIKNGEYTKAVEIGEQLFNRIDEPNLKAFLHQWIVSCIEMTFDETLRQKWIKKSNEIQGWAQSRWCLYIRKYQTALTMYFQSSYREALSLFEQCELEAENLKYERGLERTYFHLALIFKNIGSNLKSLDALSKAKSRALSRNSARMLERIENLYNALNESRWSLNQNLEAVEQLLKHGKFKAARKMILFACKIRRLEKRNWSAESENLYLALVALAFKKEKRFLFIYDSVHDPIVKERIISLSLDYNLPLPSNTRSELPFLRQSLGIRNFQPQKPSEFLGQKFWKIKSADVVSLIKLLSENIEGCTKETLCKSVWNYDYDPVIHDPKIYKLMFKTKKILGLNDAIIAVSGFYRINPKYVST